MVRLIALFFLVLPVPVWSDAWDALRAPDTFGMMRHALAPGFGDPAHFDLEDCRTQRNLNGAGRTQARRTGERLRAQGIAFDQVLTSQWCRTRETARLLAVGPVTDAPALNSFFEDRSLGAAQTDQIRAVIENAKGKILLVTHQVNISALAGRGTASGEMLVMRMVDGQPRVLGSILIAP